MTKEKRIIFELSDLTNIRLVCRKCGTETRYLVALKRQIFPPDHCSSCQAPLGVARGRNGVVGQFLRLMREVLANDETLTVGLKLELEDDE